VILDRALGTAGFRVTVDDTGQDGLGDGGYRARFLDLLLPDVDGLARLAKARSIAPDTPALILSAVSGVRSKVVCLDLGACDDVAKPCELAELVARVRLPRPPRRVPSSHQLR
jgi:DNA-binding response OmpR family regulator